MLEPGASVEWLGGRVVQSRGDVFYRVDKPRLGSSDFVVVTPNGTVTVTGTSFRVRVYGGLDDRRDSKSKSKSKGDTMKRTWAIGTTGAVVGALTVVSVYEGRVFASEGDGVDRRRGGIRARVWIKAAFAYWIGALLKPLMPR